MMLHSSRIPYQEVFASVSGVCADDVSEAGSATMTTD